MFLFSNLFFKCERWVTKIKNRSKKRYFLKNIVFFHEKLIKKLDLTYPFKVYLINFFF